MTEKYSFFLIFKISKLPVVGLSEAVDFAPVGLAGDDVEDVLPTPGVLTELTDVGRLVRTAFTSSKANLGNAGNSDLDMMHSLCKSSTDGEL